MTSHIRRIGYRIFGFAGLPAVTLVLATLLAGPAQADVKLRVEARPISDPIQAFVTVTNGAGAPVEGLTAADFTVTLDGSPIAVNSGNLTLPPSESGQKVSVVFVMDYSQSVQSVALAAMQQAVIDFANNMEDGDQVAIIKFNDTNPARASVIIPFTTIDHAANNAAIDAAVATDYPGDGTNLLDALELAVNQYLTAAPPLPIGPKAIILISDGGENQSDVSKSDVVALANANSIPIFTIGVGDLNVGNREDLMTDLGGQTGGQYFPTANDQDIADAYASISLLLTHEYLISIPSGINDCAEHELEVTVTGRAPVSVLFTRRTCDTEPNPFTFNAQTNIARGATATSNTATITGIESAAHVSIISGTYSIGCNGTFTRDPGSMTDGQTVCVRQNASDQPSTTKVTTITIGGITGTFSTTTRAGGGGGGGGGGGTTGLLELLLLSLGVHFLGKRQPA